MISGNPLLWRTWPPRPEGAIVHSRGPLADRLSLKSMSAFSESAFVVDPGIDANLASARRIAETFNAFLVMHIEARTGWTCRLSETGVTNTAPDGHSESCAPNELSDALLGKQLAKYSVRNTRQPMR